MKDYLRRYSRICTSIVGLLFIASGILKACDATAFAAILSGYDILWLPWFAPVIIVGETILGIWLLTSLYPRVASFVALLTILIFTGGYTWGLLFHEISDCGCFGDVEVLNTSPQFTYIRNLLIIIFLLPGCVFKPAYQKTSLSSSQWCLAILLTSMVSFECGNTFNRYIRSASKQRSSFFEPIALKDSPLCEFISVSPDSTYLVFAFSYTCPHCMNSIANLKEYVSSGAVDRVIALSIGDSVAEARFKTSFNPNFEIVNTDRALLKLTNKFPLTYVIKSDTIIASIRGELPAPQLVDFR